jgi:hypothetical protein
VAIEGPLKELGIHDVFQLLDLSRKTGALTVTSALRDNQGTVFFDRGSVTYAAIRSNPHPLGALLLRAGKISESDLARGRAMKEDMGDPRRLGEILVSLGAITQRELERQVRFQVEEVVFELISWHEGYFSFEEQEAVDPPAEATIRIATESLLMEGARRIDEWSRIEGKVPSLSVVPVLASVTDDHPAALDLLPNEWEVLSQIDGERDLRGIATGLARSDFDVARIAYGLVTTGVVELLEPKSSDGALDLAEAAAVHVARAREALERGDTAEALATARRAVGTDPHASEARLLVARALVALGRSGDAVDELRRGIHLDPVNASLHRELGYCAAARGELDEAIGSWERYLRAAPDGADVTAVRESMDVAARLRNLLRGRADV